MPISSFEDYIAAKKHLRTGYKIGRVSGMYQWFTQFDVAGQPGAGTLTPGNPTSGFIPTNADAGYHGFPTFSSVSILDRVSFVGIPGTFAMQWALFDRLYVAGSYNFNTNTTLTGVPALPVLRLDPANAGANPYWGLELWVEQSTTGTGIQSVTVTYTNEDGVAGRTTGAVSAGVASTFGRCYQLPLQGLDKGIQSIQSVVGSVATAGTFNVMILRRLASGNVNALGGVETQDLFATGAPVVGPGFAPYWLTMTSNSPSGTYHTLIQVTEG